jgi:hypothetical protein
MQPNAECADCAIIQQEKCTVATASASKSRQSTAKAESSRQTGDDDSRRQTAAKSHPRTPSFEEAFTLVLRWFEERGEETSGTDARVAIDRAIDAMKVARQAISDQAEQPPAPPGAPAPGSREELKEELDKEKLDPGGSV